MADLNVLKEPIGNLFEKMKGKNLLFWIIRGDTLGIWKNAKLFGMI